jgi:hypothetical protein
MDERRRYPINCGRTGAIEFLSLGDCYTPGIFADVGKEKCISCVGKQSGHHLRVMVPSQADSEV